MYWCQYCSQRFHDSQDRDEHESQDACEKPEEGHIPYVRGARNDYRRRGFYNEVRYGKC
jgi:hypothetical protein